MDAIRTRGRCILLIAIIVGFTGGGDVLASDEGQAAADMVSELSYRDFLNNWLYTHVGDDRGFGPEHDLAQANIASLFQSYGLTVTLEPVNYLSTTYYNVVGTKLGTVYPDEEYVLGGHYDSVSNPGADDNASGIALVLETARIISQFDSAYTIRFVAFDREEQGLWGSGDYVSDHSGDTIHEMIQADMVAYDPGTNNALLYGRNPLKAKLGAAIIMYSNGLTFTDGGWNGQSDHASFDAVGIQACLLIEGEVWSNPYYHTQNDNFEQPGNLNFAYAAKMTRSVVGYLVDEAIVDVAIDALVFDYPNGRPELISPAGGTRMRVEVSGEGTPVPRPGTGLLHYNVGGGWQSVPMDVIARDVYDAVFPAAMCGQEVTYYVSAQAIGGETFNNPSGAPGFAYSATAGYGRIVAFQENLDANPNWTTEDQWAFGQPTGGGGQYGDPDPTSGHTGPYVYGYNLSGDYANNLPERHLTSTAVDCTGLFDVHLKFWRWLGVERPLYDHAYVRVSNNGTNWTTVWENTSEITDTSWNEIDLDISAIADGQPTVFLRWTMGATDGGWRYCGWNIDDIQLLSLDCGPPPGDGDFDGDGDTDLADFAGFQRCFGRSPMPPECQPCDMNASGGVDQGDYGDWAAALTGP